MTALFAALCIFPLLAALNVQPELFEAAREQKPCAAAYMQAYADLMLPVVLQNAEEPEAGAVRYAAYHAAGKRTHPLFLQYLLNRFAGVPVFGCCLFLIAVFAAKEIAFSRKYIIRYIHDQDGHKEIFSGLYFVSFAQYESGGNRYGKNIADCVLRGLFCRHDRCGNLCVRKPEKAQGSEAFRAGFG